MSKQLATIAVRSILYIFSIGGLLSFISILVWYCWNYFHNHYNLTEISYLEAIGVVAIGYVGYSAINFACEIPSTSSNAWHSAFTQKEPPQKVTQTSADPTCKVPRHAEQLSAAEKEILREKIARCCGGDTCQNESETVSKEYADASR
ncbi:MAG: hypothetical protein IPM69_17935 [Ignavibacteria bacterium]|nr:hypothetical protein [Ignavibacteria bacterium]